MIQILLHGLKMDPLVSLHYYAPVCAVINLAILPFTEGLDPFYRMMELVGPLFLLTNAAAAFLLNIAAVYLVGAGSGLVLTLAGVFKVRFYFSFSNTLSNSQCAGYSSCHKLSSSFWRGNHPSTSFWLFDCVGWTGVVQNCWKQVMVLASLSVDYVCSSPCH